MTESKRHSVNAKRCIPKRTILEERTFEFAKASRAFVKRLPRTIANIEDAKQLIRASGSIGANYIEANESIGKKDFVMKIKNVSPRSQRERLLAAIARLRQRTRVARAKLLTEAQELMKIFGAIVRKSEEYI